MYPFGKKNLPFEEKMQAVHDVFSAVADRYDIMNDAMSLGLHRAWKRYFVSRIAAHAPREVLDMSTGTGDIISLLYRKLPDAEFTAADPNEAMLQRCQNRLIDEGKYRHMAFVQTHAESLPFAEEAFDAYVISFGLRNVTDIQVALREARRVLKTGGRFWCMEFHPLPESHPLQNLYSHYLNTALPFLGSVIAQDHDSYQYLGESIQTFFTPDALQKLLKDAGFTYTFCRPLMRGIVVIHEAICL